MIPDETLQKSFTILDNLSPGEILDLERIAEERRELFIHCAIQYNKSYQNLELNNLKNKIKKYDRFREAGESTSSDQE